MPMFVAFAQCERQCERTLRIMPVFAGRLQPAGPDRALREGAEEEQPDGSVRNPRGTRQPRLLRTQRLRQLDQRRGNVI